MSNKYFQTPFASDGDKAEINDQIQPDGRVSYQAGYGADYETNPAADGGKFMFIERSQMNGLLNEITGNLKAWQEQGYYTYNPAIKYDIGGRCNYNDGSGMKAYVSTVANNTRVPSINGTVQAGWELADVSTAMARFGMFGKAVYLTNTSVFNDLDQITATGFYYISNAGIKNQPYIYMVLEVISYDNQNTVLQKAYYTGFSSFPAPLVRKRVFDSTRQGWFWTAWVSLGNKGINTFGSYTTLSWGVEYVAPTNGVILGHAGVNAAGQYAQILIHGLAVLESMPGSNAVIRISYPVKVGQTCRVSGTAPGTTQSPRLARFYPDIGGGY